MTNNNQGVYSLENAEKVLAARQCESNGHTWEIKPVINSTGPIHEVACVICHWSGKITMNERPAVPKQINLTKIVEDMVADASGWADPRISKKTKNEDLIEEKEIVANDEAEKEYLGTTYEDYQLSFGGYNGPFLTLERVSKDLNKSKEWVLEKVKENRILQVSDNGVAMYPAFQFENGRMLDGIVEYLEILLYPLRPGFGELTWETFVFLTEPIVTIDKIFLTKPVVKIEGMMAAEILKFGSDLEKEAFRQLVESMRWAWAMSIIRF